MDIRIDRCVLHGPEGDVRRAQRVLMNCPWPPVDEAEVLILRRIDVQARPERLSARLYRAADGLMGQRVDGWSESAAAADCVHFRSEADMLARLSLDLMRGRAAGLWFWQSFRRYWAAPPPRALGDLWLEQAPRLAAVTRVLRERRALPEVWSGLNASAAPALLARILGPGAAAALRTDSAESTAPGAHTPPPEVVQAPETAPVAETLLAAVAAFDDTLAAPDRDLDGKDLLALTLAVAAERPHWIATADAAGRLLELGTALRQFGLTRTSPPAIVPPPEMPPAQGSSAQPQGPAPREPDAEAGPRPRQATPVSAGPVASPVSGAEEETERTAPLAPPPAAQDGQRVEQTRSDAAHEEPFPGAAGDVWHLEQGGLFYLLNLLNWRPVRERLFADPQAMAFPSGWGWLYRLGERLALEPELPLVHCLTRLSGMREGSFPAQLPVLSAAGEIAALGAQRYEGFGIWHPQLLQMPALVEFRRPELDIHFRMSDLDIGVRRAGLDLDPGWVDWLGTLVRFHYR